MSTPSPISFRKDTKDLTGLMFTRLTVLVPISRNKHGRILWLCKCSCGKEHIAASDDLRRKKVQSCGCLGPEITSSRSKTHGLTRHPLYKTWRNMIDRCRDPNHKAYKNYGGRGIDIFEEWEHSPQSFINHISRLEHCKETGYSLDRIDNNGHYEPGNLKFSTKTEQNRNRRNTIYARSAAP